MNQLLYVILMDLPKGGEQGKGSSTNFLIMMLLIFVVFYFFMIRPQVKRQKEMKNFRDSLKKGDKIVTTGGIYGKIAEINENVITVEIEDKVKMKVDKSAIIRDLLICKIKSNHYIRHVGLHAFLIMGTIFHTILTRLQKLGNKKSSMNILAMVFFIFLSTLFWFFININKTYIETVSFPVRYENFPAKGYK